MSFNAFTRPVAGLVVGTLTACLAISAQAQIIRYECRTDWVAGVSAPERTELAANRGGNDAWEAAARSRFQFNYRWRLAQEIPAQTYTRQQGGRWVGHARAYPCRVYVEGPRGTLTTSNTPESVRICGGFPTLAQAQQHGCAMFYPLRR
jgi:hypothetical protein